MAHNPIIRKANPKVPRDCPESEAAHACYEGLVFLGRLVDDPDVGEEVEVVEAVPCRRCAGDVAGA